MVKGVAYLFSYLYKIMCEEPTKLILVYGLDNSSRRLFFLNKWACAFFAVFLGPPKHPSPCIFILHLSLSRVLTIGFDWIESYLRFANVGAKMAYTSPNVHQIHLPEKILTTNLPAWSTLRTCWRPPKCQCLCSTNMAYLVYIYALI